MATIDRRAFMAGLVATASGLLVPAPVRAYSFLGPAFVERASNIRAFKRAIKVAVDRATQGRVIAVHQLPTIEQQVRTELGPRARRVNASFGWDGKLTVLVNV